MIDLAKEGTNPSLISEVLKWVSLSKGGKFIGLGAIMLLASAVLFSYVGLTPVKYRGVELVWLWVIGEILLLPGDNCCYCGSACYYSRIDCFIKRLQFSEKFRV